MEVMTYGKRLEDCWDGGGCGAGSSGGWAFRSCCHCSYADSCTGDVRRGACAPVTDIALALCRAGLQLHLKHFNRQKHDVVFTGPQHGDALASYIQFLGELGIKESEFQCVLRTQDGQARPPAWVPSTLKAQLPVRIRRIGPPSLAKASSYAKWLGIQLTEPNGSGLGHLAGIACMLGTLALETTLREPSDTHHQV